MGLLLGGFYVTAECRWHRLTGRKKWQIVNVMFYCLYVYIEPSDIPIFAMNILLLNIFEKWYRISEKAVRRKTKGEFENRNCLTFFGIELCKINIGNV